MNQSLARYSCSAFARLGCRNRVRRHGINCTCAERRFERKQSGAATIVADTDVEYTVSVSNFQAMSMGLRTR